MDEHARYGGVVPEVAARAHLEALRPTLDAALAEAGVTLAELDAIAVTSGPGLAGALMVGVGAAKALAVALGKPLYAVNHLVGHVGADLLATAAAARAARRSRCWSRAATPRCCSCAASPTTSSCSARPSTTRPARRSTRSPGCSGCPTRAGREIDRAAAGGDPTAIRFPRGLTAAEGPRAHRYDFSFSGLKTAVARWVEAARDAATSAGRGCRGRASARPSSTC